MAKKCAAKKKPYYLNHGPLQGEKVWLSCVGTLTFRCRGQVGRYNKFNEWVPLE